jgi:hypothetical protein
MQTVGLRGRLGCSRGTRRLSRGVGEVGCLHPNIRVAGPKLAMRRIETEVPYSTMQYLWYMQCLSARLNVEGRHQKSCG